MDGPGGPPLRTAEPGRTYDEVGNILAVNRTRIEAIPAPDIAGASPDVINQNDPATVVLTGTSLLGGRVTSTHPGLTIQSFFGNDARITVRLTVDAAAPLGPAELTVTTIAGRTRLQ